MVMKVLRSKKFSRRVMLGILIIIIPAFVFWGVGSLSDRPQPVGKIFGRTISIEDFMNSQQGIKIQILLNYFGDYAAMNSLLKNRNLINSMAWERLVLLNAAREEKINVGNNDVMAFIAMHPLFQRGGVFDKDIYASLLKNPIISMSPREFEELIRQNIQVKMFRDMLLKGLEVSEEDLLEEYSKNNDKVSISYFLIDKDKFSEEITVSEEEARASYDENRDRFFSPEKVDVEYIEFSYANAEEKAGVMQLMESVYPDLEDAPDNFREVAAKNGLKYGKTGFFSRNDVAPGVVFFQDFQDAAFGIEEGQVSIPLFSSAEKGTAYIIRKTSSIEPKPLTFDDIKKDLTAAIKDIKSIEMAKAEADLAHGEILGPSGKFNEAANSRGLEIKTAGLLGPSDYVENIGPARNIVAAARVNEKGSVLDPMVSQKGALIIRVDDIMPADPSSLTEEQKAELRKNLSTRMQIEKLETWFRDKASDVRIFRPLEEM
jgi:hypothetical protein